MQFPLFFLGHIIPGVFDRYGQKEKIFSDIPHEGKRIEISMVNAIRVRSLIPTLLQLFLDIGAFLNLFTQKCQDVLFENSSNI